MKNRKDIPALIIGILILVMLIVGTSYAYFQARVGNGESVEANIKTGTLGTLTFTKGEDITINVIPKYFGSGGANAEGKTNLKALLLTNYTDETKYTYNVYLEIVKNNLEYSSFQEIDGTGTLTFKTNYEKTLGNNIDYNGLTNGYEGIPELLLTVSKNGETFTDNIEGLKKATLQKTDDSYDITELREGIYPIAEEIPIKVLQGDGGLKEDEWEVTVTYKNLDNTQIINLNREFNARVRIQKEKIANDLMDVCSSGDNLKECIIKLHDNSEYGASNLILHDGEKDYEEETNYELEAGDNSYRYTGSYEKVNNYICFGEKCSTDPNDPNYHNLYRIIGVFGDEIKLVKADYANKEQLGAGAQTPTNLDNLDEIDTSKYGTYSNFIYSATVGNYEEQDAFSHRYKGKLKNVDRYIWQKLESENTLADWSTSILNKIHLNNVYLNNIGESYRRLITKHTWIWGNDNATWNNIALGTNVKLVYDNEIGTNSTTNQKIDSENIGLIYLSDYLYGAAPKNWNKKPYTGIFVYNMETGKTDKFGNPAGSFPENEIDGDYRSAIDGDWLYMGLWEWLITNFNDIATPVFGFTVHGSGCVSYTYVGTNPDAIRPTFYITNETKIKGGTGTFKNPYILDV